MKIRLMIAITALAGIVTVNAGTMDKYYKDTSGKPHYPVPSIDEPVDGTQNFWFVAPGAVRLGKFGLSGKSLSDVTDTTFECRPNCAWGKVTYKVTLLGPCEGSSNPKHMKPDRFSFSQIVFSDLKNHAGKEYAIGGTITKLLPDARGFEADVAFANGTSTCRFNVLAFEPKSEMPQVHSRHYGPNFRHWFDVYYPKDRDDKPLPFILYIHGGGWGALDKSGALGAMADGWTRRGFAVVSVGYRFIGSYEEHPAMTVPVAAPLLDAARCLQYVRYHARELGLDKNRVAATGGSAGGCTTCWLALHDDLADPASDDPIARESTRLTCAFPCQAQTSLDPKQMREWIPTIQYGAHAFFSAKERPKDKGETFDFWLSRRDEILPLIKEFSPYEWASADDPPMLHVYGGQEDVIPPKDAGNATHHPKFGENLHKRLKKLGVESWYWADNVRCENPRYDRFSGQAPFVIDHLMPEKNK